MGILSIIDSLFLSPIRRLRHGGGWMASKSVGPFRLHRFPETPLDDDVEETDVEGRPVLGSPDRRCCRCFPSLGTLVLIIMAVIITLFLSRVTEHSSILRAKMDLQNFPVPKMDWWPSKSPFPIMGASTIESGLYFPPQGRKFYPAVAAYNQAPRQRPRTPLFIPFTRNNKMLIQAVLGYISSGWPREDIVIIDNSGTFDANNRKLLSEDNPFFLDYNLLRSRYGVAVLQTPTLLNFAQLQNFMMRTAMVREWPYYFWSHMDVGILSREENSPYKSFYQRILEVISEAFPDHKNNEKPWGVKFFNFDYLTMINVETWRSIGQWDVFIPYYTTDCDAYGRLRILGYRIDDIDVGHIWDVADIVSDPESKFFPASSLATSPLGPLAGNAKPDPEEHYDGEGPNSARYKSLVAEFDTFQDSKQKHSGGRNYWQNMQKGGKGEPWTYDPEGFQTAWWETADAGRKLYEHKWKTGSCDLIAEKKKMGDLWKGAHKTRRDEPDTFNNTLYRSNV